MNPCVGLLQESKLRICKKTCLVVEANILLRLLLDIHEHEASVCGVSKIWFVLHLLGKIIQVYYCFQMGWKHRLGDFLQEIHKIWRMDIWCRSYAFVHPFSQIHHFQFTCQVSSGVPSLKITNRTEKHWLEDGISFGDGLFSGTTVEVQKSCTAPCIWLDKLSS